MSKALPISEILMFSFYTFFLGHLVYLSIFIYSLSIHLSHPLKVDMDKIWFHHSTRLTLHGRKTNILSQENSECVCIYRSWVGGMFLLDLVTIYSLVSFFGFGSARYTLVLSFFSRCTRIQFLYPYIRVQVLIHPQKWFYYVPFF